MGNQQDDDELRVFGLFVEVAQLAVSPETIQKRQPPEPDIQCVLGEHGRTCFELVEIVDSDLARAVCDQSRFQQRLSDAAGGQQLPRLTNALVFVSFARSSTTAQKVATIPALMAVLQALPAGVQGDVAVERETCLRGVVRKLRVTRREFAGPCFQVDGGTFISDPAIQRIEGKFGKTYDTTDRLELLAFYGIHPTQRAEYQLPAIEELVRNSLESSQFSRVWVFDACNRAILYCS